MTRSLFALCLLLAFPIGHLLAVLPMAKSNLPGACPVVLHDVPQGDPMHDCNYEIADHHRIGNAPNSDRRHDLVANLHRQQRSNQHRISLHP